MRHRRTLAVLLLLTGCAGGVDLLSVVVLGGVFAGIITGDLIHVAHGLGTAAWRTAATAAVAVAGFGAGVVAWARLVGPRGGGPVRHLTGAMAAETAVLAAFAAAWALVGGRPDGLAEQLALLAAAAAAMGGQSVVARTLGSSTTYLTGTFTAALSELANGGPAAATLAPLARLGALLLGAVAATLALDVLPAAAPAVPLACAVAALLCRVVRRR
ncbi:DUF1275 family protein [Allonocardiopsis opalescens]|nr:DUF1275 family protein [Allonocardiopsis opalescens]